ncbi:MULTISPECIES: condensation domain-containing protein [unclassified Streptomyces]|uniref:condensation domain-containing protein n=1 Tax=unclassified Streptomyces TaxID=2593676 RepID=UPI0033B36869
MTQKPDIRPSSPLQEALWWVQHRGGRQDLMNLTWRLRTGRLDPEILTAAWRHVVDRHEALRSAFERRGESVVRIVTPAPTDTRPQEVAWERAPADRGAESLLDDMAARLHAVPFDLHDAPLIRLMVVRAGDLDELLVTAHHSVIDGWGMQLLLDDLRSSYATVRDEGAAALDRAPGPVLAGTARPGALPRETAYWTERLRGALPAALAPVRSSAATGSGAVLRHTLSAGARTAVKAIGRRVGCTEFAVHLAAVRTVLARGGAEGLTALGTVVANRLTPADQRSVDYRANTVLLADEIRPQDTFDEVVGRARDGLWESLPYQHVTYPEVFAALAEDDRAALGTVPPVLVTHHGAIGSGVVLGDEPARLLPSPSTSARCQLLMGVFDDGDESVLELEYDTCALDEGAVRTFLADVESVLVGTADGARSVGDLHVSTRATARPARAAGSAAVRSEGDGAEAAGTVLAHWQRVFGRPVGPDDDFFDLGGHSLQVLELVALVEKSTGSELDVTAWLEEPTPARMERLTRPVSQEGAAYDEGSATPGAARATVLRPGTPGGQHLHLVHGAGVGVLPYRELAAALPADWRITVAEDDGVAPAGVGDMARHYTDRLLTDGVPDLLGGWSMGGLLAHGIAAELRARGEHCPPLLLLDPPVPGDVPEGGPDGFARAALRGAHSALPAPDRIGLGPREDRAMETLAVLLSLATGEAVGEALRARYALHARHVAAMAAHQDAHVVDVPALLVAADLTDEAVGRWRLLLPDATSVRVPADHYSLLTGAAARQVARLATRMLTAGIAVS